MKHDIKQQRIQAQPLALRTADMAEALGMDERTLARLADPPPSIKLGGRLKLYPVKSAEEWLRRKLEEQEVQ
jgi:hypothetical protein